MFFYFQNTLQYNYDFWNICKTIINILLIAVGIVLILGIGTLFKGGETSKKYSNKLMQLRVLLTIYSYNSFSWFCLFL